jgi:hypothetical protein
MQAPSIATKAISVLIASLISACSEPKQPEGHGLKDMCQPGAKSIYVIENKTKTIYPIR